MLPEPDVLTGAAFACGADAGVELGTPVSDGVVAGVVAGVVDGGVVRIGATAAVSCGRSLPPGKELGGVGSNWFVQPTPASQISGHACAS